MAFYNLGDLTAQVSSQDGYSVNSFDSTDTFAFQIDNGNRQISLNLHNMTADADVALYFDSNHNGILDASDARIALSNASGTQNDIIEASASPYGYGTYFAQVSQYDTSGITYDLDLAANYDVGTLTETPVHNDLYYIFDSDSTDVFEFNLDSEKTIHLNLNNISDGDVDLQLYQDNGNGVFDEGDTLLRESMNSGTGDDLIDYRAAAGTYFARVSRYSGDMLTYDLDMSATDGRNSNLVGGEFEMGTLSGDVDRYGWVDDSNAVDTYAFSLDFYAGVNISLTDLSADADIRLIQDHNNNGLIDNGEVIGSSVNGSNADELLSGIETSGNYFLQVSQYNSANTGYRLHMDHYATVWA